MPVMQEIINGNWLRGCQAASRVEPAQQDGLPPVHEGPECGTHSCWPVAVLAGVQAYGPQSVMVRLKAEPAAAAAAGRALRLVH